MKFEVCYKKFNKRKFVLSIIFVVLAIFCTFNNCLFVNASNNNESYSHELSQAIDSLINNIDFAELDSILINLESLDLFKGGIKDKVSQIINGEYFTNYSSVLSSLLSLIIVDIRQFLPFLFTLLAIGLLSNLITEFRGEKDGVSEIIHFVCFSVLIIVILYVFKDVLNITSKLINSLLNQIQIIFPILIAMLTSIGSFSSVSVYNPLVAVLTTIVGFIFKKLLYPIFIVMFLFSIVSNLTSTIKLDKLMGFFTSGFKWVVGIVFTLFTGFLSIQGISAGKFDSVSIKATKFAIKSYIPIIGSYISDGMDFIVLGSVLVKNTIGIIGILILFLTIFSPLISIVVLKLGVQLCSGILEMSGSQKCSNFLNNCSKLLIYPIVLILGIAFMYIITIALIMCTANIF